MNKFYLILVTMFIVGSVNGQSAWSYNFTNPLAVFNKPAQNMLIGLDEAEGNYYYEEALTNEKQGNLNEALTLYGKAAFEYNNGNLRLKYANTLMKMCSLHILLKNYAAAQEIVLNVTLKIYSKYGNKQGEMNAYKYLGLAYLADNKLPQAMWFFTQQGILARMYANKISHIESILSISEIKIKKSQFSLALADVNKAEQLAKLSKISSFAKTIAENRALIEKGRRKI